MFKATLITTLAIGMAASQEVFLSQEARLLQPGGGGPPGGGNGGPPGGGNGGSSGGSSGGQGGPP